MTGRSLISIMYSVLFIGTGVQGRRGKSVLHVSPYHFDF